MSNLSDYVKLYLMANEAYEKADFAAEDALLSRLDQLWHLLSQEERENSPKAIEDEQKRIENGFSKNEVSIILMNHVACISVQSDRYFESTEKNTVKSINFARTLEAVLDQHVRPTIRAVKNVIPSTSKTHQFGCGSAKTDSYIAISC